MLELRSLYHHRDLLWLWTMREVRVRYKQSILGGAWAILQPLSLMVIFSVVFGYFVKVPTEGIPYPVFSYSALLPWTLFATSITFAVPSLVNNISLVTKVYFPREILPFAAVGAAFMDYLVAAVLFLALMLLYGVPVRLTILFLPLLLLIQIILTLGISLLASALTVLMRDVRYIVPLALQLLMYLSPVVYPLSVVPENLRTLYLLNPMSGLIENYRRVTVYGLMPDWAMLLPSVCIGLFALVVGYAYFKHAEGTFADII